MKPYGLKTIEYENDSKKAGDLFGTGTTRAAPRRSTAVRNAFRRYKKAARNIAKNAIRESLGEE